MFGAISNGHFQIAPELGQGSAVGHFDPFPLPRVNGGCPFRRYVLVPWSAARPDVQ